jgi:hypothetical protein
LILREFHVIAFRLPETARLVPKDVFNKGLLRGTLQFGFEMGTGARTFVSSNAPYVLVVALAFAIDDLLHACLMGVAFGCGRSLMPLARYASGEEQRWDESMERTVRWAVPVATCACAAVTATAALRVLPG